jgi:two-component system, NarL family, sensor kinase
MNRFIQLSLVLILFLLSGMSVQAQMLSPETERDRLEVLKEVTKVRKDTDYVAFCYKYGLFYEGIINDSAIYYYERARQISEEIGYVSGQIRFYDYRGMIYVIESSYDTALMLMDTAYKMAVKHKSLRWQAIELNQQGTVYQYKNMMNTAADYYLKSFRIAEQIKDTQILASVSGNLSGVFMEVKDFIRSRYFSKYNYDLAAANKDTISMGYGLVNLSSSDEKDSLYEIMSVRALQAYEIAIRYNDITLLQFSLSNYASSLTHLLKLDSAIACYRILTKISSEQGNDYHLAHNLRDLAVVYSYFGKYKEARASFQEALIPALVINNHALLMTIYKGLATAEERLKNFEQALEARLLYDSYRDSVEVTTQYQQASELEVKYQNEKKSRELAQRELEILDEKSRSDRRLSLLGVAGFGLLVLLLVIYFRTRISRQKMAGLRKDIEVKELQAREDERSRLAADMHDDLGAGLSTIRMISELAKNKETDALKQDIRKISVRSEELVESMRQMIWAMSNNNNSLEDLVVYIRAYARQFLDDHQLDVAFHLPGQFPDVLIKGPVKRNIFLVVKEVLHNVVKHAQAGHVDISMDADDTGFHIIIRDNGKGLNKEEGNRFGNGLKNMERRMREINGSVELQSENGTLVTIRVPLKDR